MGSLSPRTRNAQVALYPVRRGRLPGRHRRHRHGAEHGRRPCRLRRPAQVRRPAHPLAARRRRSARSPAAPAAIRRDGTFGVTGELPGHGRRPGRRGRGAPVRAGRRPPSGATAGSTSARLTDLLRSLAAPPPTPGLKLSEEALDETTLRQLADGRGRSPPRARDRVEPASAVGRLPDAGLPQDHARRPRAPGPRRVRPPDRARPPRCPTTGWPASSRRSTAPTARSTPCPARLAGVRTLAYVANRPDWLARPGALAGPHPRAGGPALRHPAREADAAVHRPAHQRPDARPAAVREEMLAGVGADGAVTVEGHFVGRLIGAALRRRRRARRRWRTRPCAPPPSARVGPGGRPAAGPAGRRAGRRPSPCCRTAWCSGAARRPAQLTGGGPFSPRVRLFGELGPTPARERAARRLEAFVAAEASRRLAPLQRAEGRGRRGPAQGPGARPGLPADRGRRGARPRARWRPRSAALSQAERRALSSLGVRFGAFSLFLPALLTPEALRFTAAFAERRRAGLAARRRTAEPPARPAPLAPRAGRARPARRRAAWPCRSSAGAAGRAAARRRRSRPAACCLSDQALDEPGLDAGRGGARSCAAWASPRRAGRAGEPTPGGAGAEPTPRRAPAQPPPASPFAALAALQRAAPPARRRQRRRRARRSAPGAAPHERGRPAASTSGSGARASSRPAPWPPASSRRAACA